MKRFFIAWLLLCTALFGAWQIASAQMLMPIVNFGPPRSTGYQGPGNLGFGAVTAWYGTRCYSKAYSGNVADVWDAATGSTTETLITCSNGSLVATSPTAIATTCALGCNVKTLYDQTGGNNCTSATCNFVQATNGNRPAFLYNNASCPNGLSCLQFNGTSDYMQAATSITGVVQTFYISTIFNFTSNALQAIVSASSSAAILHESGVSNKVAISAGSATTYQTANDNAYHTLSGTYDSTLSAMYLDGTNFGSLNASTGGLANAFRLATTNGSAEFMTGFLAELGIWPSTSSFVPATMTTNQNSYWGL